jgi:hypothetical protein
MRIAPSLCLGLAVCAGAALGACGKKGSDDKSRPAGSAAGSAPAGAGTGSAPAGSTAARPDDGLGKLAVRVAGKPVAVHRALVKRMEPDRYQIYLSSNGGSCTELLDNLFESKDRIDVLASVSPRLNADGKQYLQITDVFEGSPTMVIAPGARVSITGGAAVGEQVSVSLDFVATAQGGAGGALAVEVHGAFSAEGCGARPPDTSGVPRAPHPTTAALTIARQRLELKGATVRGTGKNANVLLSTGPKDCSPSTPWAAVILERSAGSWRASGTWLEHEATAGEKPPTLAAAPGATGRSEDGPTIQLALSGAGDLGGFPVALEGTIEALVCP